MSAPPAQAYGLRDYQQAAIDAVHGAWDEGTQRPAVVLATGLGKTIVFSHLAQKFINRQTSSLDTLKVHSEIGSRVVVLVHRDELADQAIDKMRQVAPELHIGKVKAGNNEVDADVMVCSVQTLARERRFQQLYDAQQKHGRVGLVIVDECHHGSAKSYRDILAGLGCYSGVGDGAMAVGFTATLARGDGQGLGDVWEDAVYTRSPLWGMANKHLVPAKSKIIDVDTLHLGDVKKTAGDYQAKDLGDALMQAGGPQIIAKLLEDHAGDRKSPIIFTPTVEVARATAAALPNAAYVHGGTPREERLEIYRKFGTGEVKTLVNCMVLTEGADFPYADCVVVARPTKSQPLFIQMVGRVLRPSPDTGKKDALVLVLAGEGGPLCTLVDLEPGFRGEVQDGETLSEAAERERVREEAEKIARESAPPVAFKLSHRDVDLVRSSKNSPWLKTRGGLHFLPLGDAGEVLLWPSGQEAFDEQLWDVAYAPPHGNWERLHVGMGQETAMAWAETEAADRSSLNMGTSASWRRKPASDKLIGMVRYAGHEVPDNIKAGDASDLLAVSIATRRLDRFLPGAQRV